MARLLGDTASGEVEMRARTYRLDESTPFQAGDTALRAPEDSFYTVLHWPPTRPLLEGGGHVVGLPMRLWWVPVLYVTGVPLLLLGLTGAWLWARRRR